MNAETKSGVSQSGIKNDDGKRRYHLMPRLAEAEIVDVLTFGAQKYDEHNWQNVRPLNDRYYSAARRHLAAFLSGERLDLDSNKHHLAHAACCVLFMLEHDLRETLNDEPLPQMLQRQAD